MAENTIDLQSLDIKPQSPKYSYIGLDENNELVRTDLNAGFANIIERTCYLTSMSWLFDEYGQPNEEDVEIIEITEEQRAYNIETYELAYGDNAPLLTYSGGFFEFSSGQWNPSEGTGEVCFSRVIGDAMLLDRMAILSIKINQDGDAKGTVKIYDFYSKDEIDTKLENLVVGDVDLSNYYTKDEVNELLEDIEVDVDLDDYATVESLNTLAAKVTTVEGNVDVWDDEIAETKQHLKTLEDAWKYAYIGVRSGDKTYDEYLKNHPEINFATINGESILGTKDILIQGGSGGSADPDSYIIYLPEDYSEDTYNIDDSNDVSIVWHMYNGSDRQTHNAQVIQAINEGKVKSVYLQRIREYFSVYDWENNTFTNTAIFMYTPIQFRQKNESVDPYTRVFGYYALSEDDNNSIYLVGYNFEDDGSASLTIDRSYELEQSGGGGSNPTFDSITVNGGAYFNSEIVMAGGGQSDSSDIAEGIACAFKAGKTQSIDQWTRNIHTGTDGQGLRVCSYDENGTTQYMAVDTEGNIYEGNTKLSDKYASIDVIGDINNILSSI